MGLTRLHRCQCLGYNIHPSIHPSFILPSTCLTPQPFSYFSCLAPSILYAFSSFPPLSVFPIPSPGCSSSGRSEVESAARIAEQQGADTSITALLLELMRAPQVRAVTHYPHFAASIWLPADSLTLPNLCQLQPQHSQPPSISLTASLF